MNTKSLFRILIVFAFLILALSKAGVKEAYADLQGTCDSYDHGQCISYSYGQLLAFGSDKTDTELVPLPFGSDYDTAIPLCSIYDYRPAHDEDASWECTWEKFDDIFYGDSYKFTLKTVNSPSFFESGNYSLKALAVVLDSSYVVHHSFEFEATGSQYRDFWFAMAEKPEDSITIVGVDTYFTDGDDDFSFNMGYNKKGGFYFVETQKGNSNSFVKGKIINLSPGTLRVACQASLKIKNGPENKVKFDSRDFIDCKDTNFKYTLFYPLIVPAIVSLWSEDDYVDKNFSSELWNYGVNKDGDFWSIYANGGQNDGNDDSYSIVHLPMLGWTSKIDKFLED